MLKNCNKSLKERYSDYKEGEAVQTKFRIVVESEEDLKRLQKACLHIHDSRDIDTDLIGVNEISHLYIEEHQRIIVDSMLFNNIVEKQ